MSCNNPHNSPQDIQSMITSKYKLSANLNSFTESFVFVISAIITTHNKKTLFAQPFGGAQTNEFPPLPHYKFISCAAVRFGSYRLFTTAAASHRPTMYTVVLAFTQASTYGRRWREATDEVSTSLFALSFGGAQTNDYPQTL